MAAQPTTLRHQRPAPVVVEAATSVEPRPEGPAGHRPAGNRFRANAGRVVWGLLALGLFVGALQIMKAGAGALVPALSGSVFTDNIWSTLGLGWLGACLVLSGSPMAASSLALLDGGAIDRAQSFMMLTGSRLGASFVVLAVGFIYAMRRKGGGRRAPLSIGILALTMTFVAYIPGALLGYALLDGGHLDGVTIAASPGLLSVTDTLFGWMADLARVVVPDWGLFPLGLGVLLIAFKLFDRVLPELSDANLARHDAWYRKKWAMFACGLAVAFLTLSVSVALTLLVPLVAKGYLKREDTLPYIMGANITTLADTLVLAILTGNADATRVVMASALGVSVWTLFLLAVCFPALRRGAMTMARTTVSSRPKLALFIAVLFSVPLALVAV